MRPNHVTAAIVLRHRPFGESDKIVSFFTEEFGKLTGIAKGAMRSRRRFVNSLEPFGLVNLRFQERPHGNLAFILAADLVMSFNRLQASLERISYASYLVEITDGLVGEREENRAVYQHLKDGLTFLEENDTSLRFLTAFELKLLRLVGYQPFFDHCKICRSALDDTRANWHFSLRDGAILCESCAHSRKQILPLGTTAVEVLTALQSEKELSRASLPRSAVHEIRAALLGFIQFHMDREIKSASFLSTFAPAESGV
jgi:DNA repair protein RecO (recombination protein O)